MTVAYQRQSVSWSWWFQNTDCLYVCFFLFLWHHSHNLVIYQMLFTTVAYRVWWISCSSKVNFGVNKREEVKVQRSQDPGSRNTPMSPFVIRTRRHTHTQTHTCTHTHKLDKQVNSVHWLIFLATWQQKQVVNTTLTFHHLLIWYCEQLL